MLRTIDSLKQEQKVLLRLDLNAPVLKNKILDCPRFQEASQTISKLLEKNSKIVILAHQGRKGNRDFLSLKQHAKILEKYLKLKIEYIPFLFHEKAYESIKRLNKKTVLILENTRFFEDEISMKRDNFKELCKLFDCFINDAFSVCHREQGSIIIPPKYLESYAGLNLEKELQAIQKLISMEKKKIVFMVGGSKAEDYIPLCSKLKNKHSEMLVSGVFANLFLISSGIDLGYENEWSKSQGYDVFYTSLKRILNKNKEKIILPVDFAIGSKNIDKATRREVSLNEFPFDEKIWDVGPATITLFKKHLSNADAIFMKGPLGYSEMPNFKKGTVEILRYLSELKKRGVYTFLGGGHLTTTLEKNNIPKSFSHISTSGGSLMHALSGRKLPGIEALLKSNNKN